MLRPILNQIVFIVPEYRLYLRKRWKSVSFCDDDNNDDDDDDEPNSDDRL